MLDISFERIQSTIQELSFHYTKNRVCQIFRHTQVTCRRCVDNTQKISFRILEQMTSPKRSDFLTQMTPLLANFPNIKQKILLIQITRKIPPCYLRRNFEEEAPSLPENIKNEDLQIAVLEFIKNFPSIDKGYILKTVIMLLKNVENEDNIIAILEFIKNFPSSEKQHVLHVVKIFFEGVEKEDNKMAILQFIKNFPPSDQTHALEAVMVLFEDIKKEDNKIAILEFIHNFPSAEKTHVVSAVIMLLENINNEDDKIFVLNLIISLPPPIEQIPLLYLIIQLYNQFEILYETVVSSDETIPSYVERKCDMIRAALCKAMPSIVSHEKRILIMTFVGMTIDLCEQIKLLYSVSRLPPSKKRTTLQASCPFFIDDHEDVVTKTGILQIIKNWAFYENRSVFRLIMSFLEDIEDKESLIDIAQVMKTIPLFKRLPMMKIVMRLSKNVNKGYIKAAVMEFLHQLPFLEIVSFSKEIMPILDAVQNEEATISILLGIIRTQI